MFKTIWSYESQEELRRMLQIGNRHMRRLITAAIQEIDSRLKSDPATEGESRVAGRRVTFAGPLGIAFRVNVRLETVSIDHIWPIYWYV